MKRCSLAAMLFLLGILLPPLGAQEDLSGSCHCVKENGPSFSDGALSYFLKKTGSGTVLVARDCATGAVKETPLPLTVKDIAVTKIAVAGENIYLLGDDAFARKTLAVVTAGGEVSFLPGIMDFTLLDPEGGPVVLLKEQGGALLKNDTLSVPLSLSGDCAIKETAAKRFVLVTCGDGSELVDMIRGKSLSLFAAGKEPVEPDDFNVTLKAVDEPAGGSVAEDMVFYKVFIDGAYAGRTESAPGALVKEYSHQVAPDKHHLFKMERWELDKKSGQYKRSNNIKQPAPQRLYIPSGRIIIIDLIYDGKENRIKHYPLYQ